jgi:FtsZ-binding cell division protein ZapB
MEIPKTRKKLFEILQQHNSGDRSDQCSYLKDCVITEMRLQNLSCEELRNVRNTISRFCSKLFQKWEDCQRKNDRFVRENAMWLEQKEVLPVHVPVHEEESSWQPVECASFSQGQGRPPNTFDQSSKRTKGRKTEAVIKRFSTEELVFATPMSLRESGNVAASKLLHEAAETTPKRAAKTSLAWKKEKSCEGN